MLLDVLLFGVWLALSWGAGLFADRQSQLGQGLRSGVLRSLQVLTALLSLLAFGSVFVALAPASSMEVVAIVVVGLGAWVWVRPMLYSLRLLSDGVAPIGAVIRTDTETGRVLRVGSRYVHLQRSDGTRAMVPVTTMATCGVRVVSSPAGAYLCEFSVPVPPGVADEVAIVSARRAAQLSPYASPSSEPDVFVEPDESSGRSLRIRAHAFDFAVEANYVSNVRRRLVTDLAEVARGVAEVTDSR